MYDNLRMDLTARLTGLRSAVIGEIMADLAEKGETRHEIEMFRLGRLTAQQTGKDNSTRTV